MEAESVMGLVEVIVEGEVEMEKRRERSRRVESGWGVDKVKLVCERQEGSEQAAIWRHGANDWPNGPKKRPGGCVTQAKQAATPLYFV